MTVRENLLKGAYADATAIPQLGVPAYPTLFPAQKSASARLRVPCPGVEQALWSIGFGLIAALRLLIIDEPLLGAASLKLASQYCLSNRM